MKEYGLIKLDSIEKLLISNKTGELKWDSVQCLAH